MQQLFGPGFCLSGYVQTAFPSCWNFLGPSAAWEEYGKHQIKSLTFSKLFHKKAFGYIANSTWRRVCMSNSHSAAAGNATDDVYFKVYAVNQLGSQSKCNNHQTFQPHKYIRIVHVDHRCTDLDFKRLASQAACLIKPHRKLTTVSQKLIWHWSFRMLALLTGWNKLMDDKNKPEGEQAPQVFPSIIGLSATC